MFRCVNVYVPNGTLTEICRTCLFPMLLKKLREEVLEANLELVRRGLVVYTFGNASGIDRSEGLVAIKPSGVPYEELTPAHMVIFDLDWQTHRRGTAPLLGPPDSSRAVPTVPEHRRRGAHAFGIRDRLGPSREADPLFRNYPRRLFPRFNSCDGSAYTSTKFVGTTNWKLERPSAGPLQSTIPIPFRRFSSMGMLPLPGAERRRRGAQRRNS